MARQTPFEHSAGRGAAARGRARIAPTIDDDDTDTFPIITEADLAAASLSDDAPDEWQVGDVVAGRFVLQQRLGRGQYGPVFKALDRAVSEPQLAVEHHVALEELPRRIAESATFIERLGQLRLYPQSWSHPNIAKVLEFGRDGAKHFFCGELLEGASLRVVLDASAPNPLEEHEVRGILRYVGDALSYAHAKGVVHGGLRLDNVIVTEAYEVKLTGFLPSTEPRLEPVFVEDRHSAGQPHPSDDVYGLACLAYELLTRRHPYDGKTPLEALRAGLTAHPALILSPPQSEALSRGLALRRERRTATIAELLAGLGVTGDETLLPAPKSSETTAPSRNAAPAETTPWPEITSPPPPPSGPSFAASPAAAPPASQRFSAARWAEPFAEIYPEPAARRARARRERRRAAPIGTILGVLLVAGFGAYAYLNHAWLRDRAADFIETAMALAPPARSVPTAGARPATEPPGAPTTSAPPAPPVSASAPESEAAAASAAASEPAAASESAAASEPSAASEPAAAPEPAPAAESPPSQGTAVPAPSDLPAPVRAAPQPPPAAAAAVAAPPRFVFAERTLTVNEWESSARVLIRRTGPLDEEASAVWWTTEGTAVADEDYAVLGARVARFAAGEDTQVLYVPLIADSLPEGRESFVMNLRGERAGGAAAQLEVIVVDDDR